MAGAYVDKEDSLAVVFSSDGEREDDRRILLVTDNGRGEKGGGGMFSPTPEEPKVGIFAQAQVVDL